MVKLQKDGPRVNITKGGVPVTRIGISLIWDNKDIDNHRAAISQRIAAGEKINPNSIPSPKFDPDLSGILLGPDGHLYAGDEHYLLSYCSEANKVKLDNGSIIHKMPNDMGIHYGDTMFTNKTEVGTVGREDIMIDVEKFPVDEQGKPKFDSFSLFTTIDKFRERNHKWSLMNARLEIRDLNSDELIETFDFGQNWGEDTSVQIGSFYPKVLPSGLSLEFVPVAMGAVGTIEPYLNMYGIETEE